jgi:hypothetical protein
VSQHQELAPARYQDVVAAQFKLGRLASPEEDALTHRQWQR